MPPKPHGSSAAGKQPKDAPPPLAFEYGERERPVLADTKMRTAKGWARFVKPVMEGSQLSFPSGFCKSVFPDLSIAEPPLSIEFLHCGKCSRLWHCLEIFPEATGCEAHNTVSGYVAGIFRTCACFFFRQNGDSLDGYEDSAHEDLCFRTLQVDRGGVIYLEPKDIPRKKPRMLERA